MIELLDPIPPDMLSQGSRSSQYFYNNGQMKNIHQLHPVTLEEKIKLRKNKGLSDDDVAALSSFLRSLLQYRPKDRKDALGAALVPWLWRD
ncbi:hypothetical protein EPUS_06447 [Endocarpon pusillum Z07020]|uniref:non-specific serine/threonine protein kinase n=1 Tax=Endocarpon pusillum (strain Z07020 / HMAS-L-300199) TaxID=1263415 RepID=U1GHM2_ENDPU|nr:uncharacterized protein EPUS_06447 [Endocarpon pusillum Z07020]ERF77167.1 hypothetical protein EPUS_06447 [Endocarpon pusillum Z07020]